MPEPARCGILLAVTGKDEWQDRANRRFRDDDYARHYEARYKGFGKGVVKQWLRYAVLRRAFRDLPAGSLVLDIPCGTGRYLGWLVSRGYRVLEADIAAEMIRVARTRPVEGPGAAVGWVAANALNIPLPDKSIDAALTVRLFHLVPKEARVGIYREMRRVCRRQAILCFNCNKWAFKHWGKRLRGEAPDYLMTRKELRAELESGGLRVERIHGKGGIFSTLWAVVCSPA